MIGAITWPFRGQGDAPPSDFHFVKLLLFHPFQPVCCTCRIFVAADLCGCWKWERHMDGIWLVMLVYEGRSKFVVEQKCVTKLVSPLSFYMVSCFYIFLPLPKHSFEANLLGSSSLPIFVCMHWETLVVFVVSHVVPPLRCSGGLSNQQLFWFFFGHVLATRCY